MHFCNPGQVYVFGRGDSGQLGLEDKESKSTAHLLPSLEDVSGISAGASFSLATTNAPSDNLYAWGYGEMGQLANESQDADVPFQVAIKSRHVIQAAAGGQHTVLLLSPRE